VQLFQHKLPAAQQMRRVPEIPQADRLQNRLRAGGQREEKAMMCNRCGYKNDNSAKSCRSCSATLEAKPSEEQLEKTLNKLSDKSSGDLMPSPLERILKWVFFASAPVFLVLGILLFEIRALGLFAAILSVFAGVGAGYPKFMWGMQRFRLQLMTDTGDLKPSGFWVFGRKIGYWVVYGMAVAVVLYALDSPDTGGIAILLPDGSPFDIVPSAELLPP
jgi:ribosomal protein L40E